MMVGRGGIYGEHFGDGSETAPAPSEMTLAVRACWFCHAEIKECMGFVLARDVLEITESVFLPNGPRELCQFCADKVGEIISSICKEVSEIRVKTIEECAQIAEREFSEWSSLSALSAGEEIAEKLRALYSKG